MRSVKSPPDDFDDSRLLPSLAEGWGIESRSAEYLTVGFGSYHWLVTDTTGRRLFVTVDDLRQKEWLGNTPEVALGGLRNAFDAALSLRDEGGLDFVIAPLPTARGETVRRIGMRHAVAVFPFISGRPGHFGDDDSPAERAEVAGLLAKLHRPASAAPRSAVRREPGITARDALEEALADVNHPWSGGPFSEPTRDWLARNVRTCEVSCASSTVSLLALRRPRGVLWSRTGNPIPAISFGPVAALSSSTGTPWHLHCQSAIYGS